MVLKNNVMGSAFARAGLKQQMDKGSSDARGSQVPVSGVKQSSYNANYDPVDEAEAVIKNLIKDKKDKYDNIALKTTQIRKFLTAVNVLRNKVDVYCAQNVGIKTLSKELAIEVKFLKVSAFYLVGREKSGTYVGPVEDFVKKAKLEEKILHIGDNIAAFEKFCKYIEALVAFHKYYGGKD